MYMLLCIYTFLSMFGAINIQARTQTTLSEFIESLLMFYKTLFL